MPTKEKVIKDRWYTIPHGEYRLDFLRGLTMCAHVGILEPTELEYWFDEGKTQEQMITIMKKRLTKHRNENNDH